VAIQTGTSSSIVSDVPDRRVQHTDLQQHETTAQALKLGCHEATWGPINDGIARERFV
jgi:hypothetical protein